jgi:transcriptional regulator with XRE-family HTH domain
MIGDNIRILMDKNNLTQTELAIRSGCRTGDISRYVNNKQRPRVPTLQRLADALGVSVVELCNGKAGKAVQSDEQNRKNKAI